MSVFTRQKQNACLFEHIYFVFVLMNAALLFAFEAKRNRRLTSFSRKLWSRLPSCKIKPGRKRRRIKNKILIVKTRMMIKNANKTVNCYFTLNQSAISSRNNS